MAPLLGRPASVAAKFATPATFCPDASRRACSAAAHARAATSAAAAQRHDLALQRSLRMSRLQGSSVIAAAGSATPRRSTHARYWQRLAATASMNRQQVFQDSTMWAGDAVVLLLTQLSSDRLPLENQGLVSTLVLTTWTAVAWLKRDYTLGNADYDAWSVLAPVTSAVRGAALTWVIFTPLAAAGYGGLWAAHLLWVPPALVAPPAAAMSAFSNGGVPWLVAPDATDGMAAPELEVLVALLFCMCAWRGLYSAYRAWSNFF